MHEMHLIRDFFDDLLSRAKSNQATKITKVYIVIGDFTEINEDILKFFFKENGKGTPLEDAQLVIEKSPVRELRLVSFDCE